MASQDLKNRVYVKLVLAPIVGKNDTDGTHTDKADLKGYESATLVASSGAEGDTLSGFVKFIPVAMESDDGTTFTAVAAADLIGAFTVVDANGSSPMVQYVGYLGTKRYVTVDIDFTGTHTNGTPVAAWVVKGHARVLPATM